MFNNALKARVDALCAELASDGIGPCYRFPLTPMKSK
jgi:hypothetical protein